MRLWRDLFGFERPASWGEAVHFRLFEALIGAWVLLYAWQWGLDIQKNGDVVLPLGLARWIDVSFMFEHGVSLINAGVMTVGFVLGFSRIGRWGYVLTLIAFHLQYVSRYCLGEISHGSNLVGMSVLGLAIGTVSFSDEVSRRRMALGLIVFFVGLGYSSAAVCKLVATGPLWVDGHHLWLWIHERTVDGISKWGSVEHNFVQQLALDSRMVATAILLVGLLSEAFAWLLWFRDTRVWIGMVLLGMHIGIWLSMDILFLANEQLLVALAVPWPSLIDRLRMRMTDRGSPAIPTGA